MNGFYAAMIGWSFAVGLFVIVKLFSCKHKWELVDKTVIPSRLEVMKANWCPSTAEVHQIVQAAKVNVMIVIRCSGCGAAKVLRGSN